MAKTKYVHGTSHQEQARLAKLNEITNQAFIEFLRLKPNDTVLEIGAGLGILASQVAEITHDGHVIGVEFSEEQIARRRGFRDNFYIVRADAHHLPFASNTFDTVYCRYVLEHVNDAYGVIQEAYRVLKPGGRFFTQENNIAVNLFYPECPVFEHVWLQLGKLQEILGSDGYVGKKLFAYFHWAGFRGTELTALPEIHHAGMPTFHTWVENLMHIIEASRGDFIKHGLLTEAAIAAGMAECDAFMRRDDAAAYFYWNRAAGTK